MGQIHDLVREWPQDSAQRITPGLLGGQSSCSDASAARMGRRGRRMEMARGAAVLAREASRIVARKEPHVEHVIMQSPVMCRCSFMANAASPESAARSR